MTDDYLQELCRSTERDMIASVKAAMDQLSMSQSELSRRTGLDQSHISKLLAGRRHPSLATVCRMLPVVGLRLVVTPLPRAKR